MGRLAEQVWRARGALRLLSSDDGLATVAEFRPDVALVDVGLPGIDGYEVARQVRLQMGDSLYLVALTGHGGAEAIARARQAGFNRHLLKPIRLTDLNEVVLPANH